MKFSWIIGVLGLVLSLSVFADDKSSGCGLGWKVTKRASIASSSIRSSTNGTFSNTSGMTSGTSGCERHMLVLEEKQSLHFAEANYNSLMVEMAAGSGEYLEAFAAVLGCQPGVVKDFSSMTQSKYGEIFGQGAVAPAQMLENVRSQVRSDATLAKGCGAIAG